MVNRFIETTSKEYPLSFSDLRARHPNVTVPHDASDHALLRLGYARVNSTERPEGDVVNELPPVMDAQGVWHQQWEARDFTQEELDQQRQASVPESVTMRQARLELLNRGLLSSIETAIDSLPEPERSAVQIEWEYSQTVERNRPFVLMVGQALGLNQTELDDLFIEAKSL